MINSSARPEALKNKKEKRRKREAAIATRELGDVQGFWGGGGCRKRWGCVSKDVKSVSRNKNIK